MLKYKIDKTQKKEFLYKGVSKTVYKIIAMKDFGNVRAGDKGGYIEAEKNLSQEGDCWVFPNSVVLDNAIVKDRAIVNSGGIISGNVQIKDLAIVLASNISGNAIIMDESIVRDSEINSKEENSNEVIVFNKSTLSDCNVTGNISFEKAFVENTNITALKQLDISDSAVYYSNLKISATSSIKTSVVYKTNIKRKIISKDSNLGFDVNCRKIKKGCSYERIVSRKEEDTVNIPLNSFKKAVNPLHYSYCSKYKDNNKILYKVYDNIYENWKQVMETAYSKYKFSANMKDGCKKSFFDNFFEYICDMEAEAFAYYVSEPILFKKILMYIQDKDIAGKDINAETFIFTPLSDSLIAFYVDTVFFDIINKFGFLAREIPIKELDEMLLNGDAEQICNRFKAKKRDIKEKDVANWVNFLLNVLETSKFDLKGGKLEKPENLVFINSFIIKRATEVLKEKLKLSFKISSNFLEDFYLYVQDDNRFVVLPSRW